MNNRTELHAGISTLILVISIAAYAIGYFLSELICFTIPLYDGYDSSNFEHIMYCFSWIALPRQVVGHIVSGVVMLTLSIYFLREQLKNTSPTGAAWVLGNKKDIIRGMFIGILIGIVVQVTRNVLGEIDHEPINVQDNLLLTIGFVYAVFGFTVQPIIEEMLYRGIVLGGFNKRFGLLTGGIATSVIFIMMHMPTIINSIPALIGTVSMALCTIWIRIRSHAVGPAAVMHIFYNLVCSINYLRLLFQGIY